MLEIKYLKCYLALRVKFNGVKKKDMKLDTKTLLIGAVAVGGFLYYRHRQKQKALAVAQSQSDDGGDTLGGGGGGGFGGSTSPTPTTATAPVVVVPTTNEVTLAEPIKEPIKEPIATKPTTETTTKPITRPIEQSKPTAITSKFLTFDGEYSQNDNVVLDFEGNID